MYSFTFKFDCNAKLQAFLRLVRQFPHVQADMTIQVSFPDSELRERLKGEYRALYLSQTDVEKVLPERLEYNVWKLLEKARKAYNKGRHSAHSKKKLKSGLTILQIMQRAKKMKAGKK